MSEPLDMTLQERLAILAFAGKSAEMLELADQGVVIGPVDRAQWTALRTEAVKVLKRLDADNPTLLPLPHDGVGWKDRPLAPGETSRGRGCLLTELPRKDGEG